MAKPLNMTIDAALQDSALLGAALGDPTPWSTWLATLKAAFGEKLSRTERRAFRTIAGSRKPPKHKVRELWAVAGRGSGKSRMSAAIAVYPACFQQHDLDAGEQGYVFVLAGSRDQAQMVFSYASAFLRRSAILRKLIKSTTAHEIRLTNGVTIAVHSNSFRLIRGKTLLACIFDEIAFWRDDTSANPDVETYRAVRPSLARTGGLLVGISSPYRKAGLLHQKYQDHYDTNNSRRGSDDFANSLVGAMYCAFRETRKPKMMQGAIGVDGSVHWKDNGTRPLLRFVTVTEQDDLLARGLPVRGPARKASV
jgi:Terminase large subunit, ATPase domain